MLDLRKWREVWNGFYQGELCYLSKPKILTLLKRIQGMPIKCSWCDKMNRGGDSNPELTLWCGASMLAITPRPIRSESNEWSYAWHGPGIHFCRKKYQSTTVITSWQLASRETMGRRSRRWRDAAKQSSEFEFQAFPLWSENLGLEDDHLWMKLKPHDS